jgi:hypothetical protein
MTYLAQELVARSWYLSGIVARNLETVSGDQLSDGLQMLNNVLSFKSTDLHLIPYFKQYELNLIPAQEIYFVPNLLAVETMTFNIGPVRYSMNPIGRSEYFGSSRVDNIQSLPGTYHTERLLDGSNVYVYFLPNQIYPAKIWGKFGLTNVIASTDLDIVYDPFYSEYLRYALAEYICNEYNIDLQPGAARMLAKITKKLTSVDPADLSMRKASTLQEGTALNYAQANLGHGWTVG